MLTRLRVLFWVGVFVLFLPYYGITDFIRSVITFIAGFGIIFLALRLRHDYKLMKLRLKRLEQPVVEQSISTNTEEKPQMATNG